MNNFSANDALARFLKYPDNQDCLILVHSSIEHLLSQVMQLKDSYCWSHIVLGGEIGPALLTTPVPERRSRSLEDWLSERLFALKPGPVLCTGIDVLFEPSLNLDPLMLFRRISRVTRLVVAWPGSYRGTTLTYAVPDHKHYRIWREHSDVLVALL